VQNKQLLILKSLGEAINKKPLSDYNDLVKAIAPFTIKTIKGKTLIWVQIASGKWDWRKFDPKKHAQYSGLGTKTNVSMESGNLIDTSSTGATTDVVDFPDNLDDLEIVKSLGGSTGANLVKDKNTGKLFVSKQGNSNEHIKEEYMTNKIYELLGTPGPNVRFYEEQGKRSTMLSVYLEDTEAPNLSDKKQIEELKNNFVADCLLANWDVYQNDNLLFDKKSNIIVRVDNGGGLRRRAKGGDKGSSFSDNIMDDITSMKSHNKSIAGDITAAQIKSQMVDILAKESDVIDFLEEMGEIDLMRKMAKRFKSIDEKLNQTQRKTTEIKDLFKNLKCDYEDLTQQEMDDVYSKLSSQPGGVGAIDSNASGWQLLVEVGKMRGFDKKPEVLSDDDFNTMVGEPDTILAHRGTPTEHYYNQFINSDSCWYGSVGVYGAGIYSAINLKKELGDVSSAYQEAKNGYGGYVKDILVTKDYKTIKCSEIDKLMQEEFFGDAYHKLKKEITNNIQIMTDIEQAIKDKRKEIEIDVKDELGFDQNTLNLINSDDFANYSNDANFSDKAEAGKRFSEIIDTYKTVMDSIKGTYEVEDNGNVVTFYTQDNQSFKMTKDTWVVSMKQKSPFLPKYNYQEKRFQDFVRTEHFDKIQDEIAARLKFDKKIKNYFGDLEMYKVINKKLEGDAEGVKKNGASNLHPLMRDVLNGSQNHISYRGLYAMLKGYDGLIEDHGNHGVPYLIILNRSKLILRQKEETI
jgi:hypothetical protein